MRFDRTCRHCGHPTHGKPSLVWPHEAALDFSVAYAGRHALVAVARGTGVGVDLERVVPLERLPVSCQSVEEGEALRAAAPPGAAEERAEALVRTWVRKEAYAKASGLGLALDLSLVAVAGEVRAWSLPRPGWRVEDVPIDSWSGLVGAVACAETAAVSVQDWTW